MPRKLAKLSPKLETELRDKLEDLLDEHDDVDEKRRRVAKALKGHLSILDDSISLVRRQLKGQDLDQLEIPGTHLPEPAKDPVVAEILKLAGGIVPASKPDEDDGGEDLSGEEEALEDENAEREDAPIRWGSPNRYGKRWGRGAKGRTYFVAPCPNGFEWQRPGTGVGCGGAGPFPTVEEAKKDAERAELETRGDALLKNAGAGELTKADTKGPAVARKKGGRRG